jgi:hypothetical protein
MSAYSINRRVDLRPRCITSDRLEDGDGARLHEDIVLLFFVN